MKIYLDKNVYDAALERIRFLFDEFDEVIVSFSGGKDSTVCLNLCMQVAKEKGRLPLRVMFIDQEAEWGCVIDYIRSVMTRPDVLPMWFQIPIKLFNATSTRKQWLMCWAPGESWMREKEPFSIKENVYGTDRFHNMFDAIIKKEFKDKKACFIGGVRAEESPSRFIALTYDPTYKHITYGKKINPPLHYTFYPLYDWSYTDIWKSIHDNVWVYCRIYDYYYQRGIPVNKMRVSNLHHETAINALYILQEIEPETWNRLTARLPGIGTVSHLGKEDFMSVRELPFMFKDWKEYRDYLLDNLITDPVGKQKFKIQFSKMDRVYSDFKKIENIYHGQIAALLTNDYHMTKLSNLKNRPEYISYRKRLKGIDQTGYGGTNETTDR